MGGKIMKVCCEKCGKPLEANEKFCSECGTENLQYEAMTGVRTYNTGLMVWSIINLFLCNILGLIAMMFTMSARNAATPAQATKDLKVAKILNIVATVVGCVVIILSVVFTLVTFLTLFGKNGIFTELLQDLLKEYEIVF
ncbi:MAG: zinc-ribbon domain-containing protein [Ruminococcaceae bacterium]|nr:zinc-ribbon domain-containing protein [Oscillospiraceae bacterium]